MIAQSTFYSLDQLTAMVADFTETCDTYELMDQKTGVAQEDGPFVLIAAKQTLMCRPKAVIANLQECADDDVEAESIIETIERYQGWREKELEHLASSRTELSE